MVICHSGKIEQNKLKSVGVIAEYGSVINIKNLNFTPSDDDYDGIGWGYFDGTLVDNKLSQKLKGVKKAVKGLQWLTTNIEKINLENLVDKAIVMGHKFEHRNSTEYLSNLTSDLEHVIEVHVGKGKFVCCNGTNYLYQDRNDDLPIISATNRIFDLLAQTEEERSQFNTGYCKVEGLQYIGKCEYLGNTGMRHVQTSETVQKIVALTRDDRNYKKEGVGSTQAEVVRSLGKFANRSWFHGDLGSLKLACLNAIESTNYILERKVVALTQPVFKNNSSAGYHTGLSNHNTYMLTRPNELNSLINLQQFGVVHEPYAIHAKIEEGKITKEVRTIQASSSQRTGASSLLTIPIKEVIINSDRTLTSLCIGLKDEDVEGIMAKVNTLFSDYYVTTTDCTSMECTIPPEMITTYAIALIYWYKNGTNLRKIPENIIYIVQNLIASCLRNVFVTGYGFVYVANCGNPSGIPITTMINSYVTEVKAKYYLLRINYVYNETWQFKLPNREESLKIFEEHGINKCLYKPEDINMNQFKNQSKLADGRYLKPFILLTQGDDDWLVTQEPINAEEMVELMEKETSFRMSTSTTGERVLKAASQKGLIGTTFLGRTFYGGPKTLSDRGLKAVTGAVDSSEEVMTDPQKVYERLLGWINSNWGSRDRDIRDFLKSLYRRIKPRMNQMQIVNIEKAIKEQETIDKLWRNKLMDEIKVPKMIDIIMAQGITHKCQKGFHKYVIYAPPGCGKSKFLDEISLDLINNNIQFIKDTDFENVEDYPLILTNDPHHLEHALAGFALVPSVDIFKARCIKKGCDDLSDDWYLSMTKIISQTPDSIDMVYSDEYLSKFKEEILLQIAKHRIMISAQSMNEFTEKCFNDAVDVTIDDLGMVKVWTNSGKEIILNSANKSDLDNYLAKNKIEHRIGNLKNLTIYRLIRDREELGDELLEVIKNNQGRCIMIGGLPNTGKTTLARSLVAKLLRMNKKVGVVGDNLKMPGTRQSEKANEVQQALELVKVGSLDWLVFDELKDFQSMERSLTEVNTIFTTHLRDVEQIRMNKNIKSLIGNPDAVIMGDDHMTKTGKKIEVITDGNPIVDLILITNRDPITYKPGYHIYRTNDFFKDVTVPIYVMQAAETHQHRCVECDNKFEHTHRNSNPLHQHVTQLCPYIGCKLYNQSTDLFKTQKIKEDELDINHRNICHYQWFKHFTKNIITLEYLQSICKEEEIQYAKNSKRISVTFGSKRIDYIGAPESAKKNRRIKNIINKVNRFFKTNFNSMIVNIYLPGGVIKPHKDDEPQLDLSHGVLGITVKGDGRLNLHRNRYERPMKSFKVDIGSTYLLSGEALTDYYHSRDDHHSDLTISYTFRRLK